VIANIDDDDTSDYGEPMWTSVFGGAELVGQVCSLAMAYMKQPTATSYTLHDVLRVKKDLVYNEALDLTLQQPTVVTWYSVRMSFALTDIPILVGTVSQPSTRRPLRILTTVYPLSLETRTFMTVQL
jgi:hypothetical protein